MRLALLLKTFVFLYVWSHRTPTLLAAITLLKVAIGYISPPKQTIRSDTQSEENRKHSDTQSEKNRKHSDTQSEEN